MDGVDEVVSDCWSRGERAREGYIYNCHVVMKLRLRKALPMRRRSGAGAGVGGKKKGRRGKGESQGTLKSDTETNKTQGKRYRKTCVRVCKSFIESCL